MIILLMLLTSLVSYSQVVVTQVPTTTGFRTKVTSTVKTLICTFDNIGGATTTIHISCKVPLGYILIETTTPRFTPIPINPPGTNGNATIGGTVGCFKDDNGNTVTWLLQQLIKGIVNYQITDNLGAVNMGTFSPPPIVADILFQAPNDCQYSYTSQDISIGLLLRNLNIVEQ